MFDIGDKVRMSAIGKHRYFPSSSNPHDDVGIVSYLHEDEEDYNDGDDWYRYEVTWSSGISNSYREVDIEYATFPKLEEFI